MALFIIPLLFILPKLNAEVFSSTAHLSTVLNTEREIVSILERFIDETETLTMQLRSYISEFDRIQVTSDYDELVGNPIHSYQLLKYLTVDWKHLEKKLNESLWQDVIRAIQLRRETVLMPQEEDLQGAALALLRLQETYQLNASDLARGNILGVQSTVGLSARDCFYLGQHSAYHSLTKLAVEWYTHTLRIANDDNSMDPDYIIPHLENAVHEYELTLSTEGHKTPKLYTLDRDRSTTEMRKEDDNLDNYQALCRGEHLRRAEEEATLFCYLSDQEDPYFTLMPIKIEIQSHDPPIFMFHDVIHESEMHFIKDFSKPFLERSQIFGHEGDKISNTRTSQNTWLYDSYQDDSSRLILKKLMDRMSWVTGLNVHGEINSEALQVANYGIGGHYAPHHDYLNKLATLHKEHGINGDRIATLMFYLSNVERGGATVFPRIGVAVWPKKGSAVFWYNLMQNGQPDPLTLHGACPVLLGSKWVGNKWIRELNQVFKRPCSMNPTD